MNFSTFLLLFSSYFIYCNADMVKQVISVFGPGLKCSPGSHPSLDVKETVVYFYDFKRGACQIFSERIGTVTDKIFRITNLDKKRKIVVYVPGFRSSIQKTSVDIARETFKNNHDIYLMIVDHSHYTNADETLKMKKAYETAVSYVHEIGRAVGNMLTKLIENGIPAKNIHCIGHSLGSHMVGQAGKTVTENTGQKIARITALDPAKPCFEKTHYQVEKGVAEYVEVYHCNAGVLSIKEEIGDVLLYICLLRDCS